MKSCEMWGKELLDASVINPYDLCEWLKAKNSNDGPIIGVVCLVILFFRIFSTALNLGQLV